MILTDTFISLLHLSKFNSRVFKWGQNLCIEIHNAVCAEQWIWTHKLFSALLLKEIAICWGTPLVYSSTTEGGHINCSGMFIWVHGERFAFISEDTVTNTRKATATMWTQVHVCFRLFCLLLIMMKDLNVNNRPKLLRSACTWTTFVISTLSASFFYKIIILILK